MLCGAMMRETKSSLISAAAPRQSTKMKRQQLCAHRVPSGMGTRLEPHLYIYIYICSVGGRCYFNLEPVITICALLWFPLISSIVHS